MPAIEFIGYSREEAVERMSRYIPLFAHLDWVDDFIFQIEADSKVIGSNRIEQPLVRGPVPVPGADRDHARRYGGGPTRPMFRFAMGRDKNGVRYGGRTPLRCSG
jgi:hypothetical protein